MSLEVEIIAPITAVAENNDLLRGLAATASGSTTAATISRFLRERAGRFGS